jgi:putative transposase
MPWTETVPMRERVRFVSDVGMGLYGMKELCERYGVSRKTGYKWVKRFEEEGEGGLEERSRAPQRRPGRTVDEVVEAIVAVRKKHPRWGPRKILEVLREGEPKLELPAASTAGEWLRRAGLVERRKRRARWQHPGRPVGEATGPNQIWTADFKGQFRMRDGVYCYPLTVMDRYSRYLLTCDGRVSTEINGAKAAFERLFREVGLPEAIRTDNGEPFASRGIHGLTALNVVWLRLGIRHQRIQRGHPEQNGSHERMHRDLKAETTRPPGEHLRLQQERFDRFRTIYNTERPHEALSYRKPASVWQPPARQYPANIGPPEYPGHFEKRLISDTGCFSFKGRFVFLSTVLAHEWIGLEAVDDGVWSLVYYNVLLARFAERTFTVHP